MPAPLSSPGSWRMLYGRWSPLPLPSLATPPASSPCAAFLLPQAPRSWAWPWRSDTVLPRHDAWRSRARDERARGLALQSSSCLAPALAFLLLFLPHSPTCSPTRPPPTIHPSTHPPPPSHLPAELAEASLGSAVRACITDRPTSTPVRSRVWSQAAQVQIQLHHELCDLGVSLVYPSGPQCLSGTMRRKMVPAA